MNLKILSFGENIVLTECAIGQLKGFVTRFHGSSASRGANTTAAAQPGKNKITTGTSKKT